MDKRVFLATAGTGRVVFGLTLLVSLMFGMTFDVHATPAMLYAKPSASGTGDCSTWANACTLQTALTQAVSGDKIWVARGVHYPGTSVIDRFDMVSGVEVYGGFTGTETLLSERDWVANPTVLSGDIDQNDTHKDANGIVTDVVGIQGSNSNVVVNGYEIDATGVLDGFFINAGQSTNEGGGVYVRLGSPTLRNLVIGANRSLNSGAGLYNSSGSPNLINVAFRGNSVTNNVGGGGMFSFGGNPTLSNVLFSGNYAFECGGFESFSGSPTLINATFSGNRGSTGGAIKILSDTTMLTLTNAIIWGNSAAITVYGSATSINVNYSIVEGGYPGNFNYDPLFLTPQPYTNAPTTAGDYHLSHASPAIDAGNNSLVTLLTDLDNKSRIFDGDGNGVSIVDMGAYEWSPYSLFLPLIRR